MPPQAICSPTSRAPVIRGVMNRIAANATFDSQPKTSAFMKAEKTVASLSSIGIAPMIGSWNSVVKRS